MRRVGDSGPLRVLHDVGLSGHMELAMPKPTRLTEEGVQDPAVPMWAGPKILDQFSVPEGTSGHHPPRHQPIPRTHRWAWVPEPVGRGRHPSLRQNHPHGGHLRDAEPRPPWRPRPSLTTSCGAWWRRPGVYDGKLLRLLVDALSFYPPGTCVRLNSGEVGRVFSRHPGATLRPRCG